MINVLVWAMVIVIWVGKAHRHPPGPPIEGEPESLEPGSRAHPESARRLPTLLGFGPVGHAVDAPHVATPVTDADATTGHMSAGESAPTPTP